MTELRPTAAAEVLAVAGEVDLLSASTLEDAIAAALAREPALLVIDLTEVSFLASVGMTVLLKARRAEATRLRVVAPADGAVGRALELMGLREVLAIATTRADALSE
ncbi:STAS domain-containing protein [Amycolatopsis sp. OK19-0408]|uniref:STAS domain-containing protein n=1 Tax=Amycolatopsis iheyensis TaxID=2945988 RepID=A0A9X2NEN2_9PSEU|nr:STAS domain-containing protein [Amycolatopsis iheyensis]MCR6483180.1 STAS domain-containing protein [Amycolatopsis iheyensis]